MQSGCRGLIPSKNGGKEVARAFDRNTPIPSRARIAQARASKARSLPGGEALDGEPLRRQRPLPDGLLPRHLIAVEGIPDLPLDCATLG